MGTPKNPAALEAARREVGTLIDLGRMLAATERRLGTDDLPGWVAEHTNISPEQLEFIRWLYGAREQVEAKIVRDPEASIDVIKAYASPP
jgi:hypothetical protein